MKTSRPPRNAPLPDPSPRGSSGPPEPDAHEIVAGLAEVKDKLVRSERFADVMDRFFDLLGTDLAFMTKGIPIDDAPERDALLPIADQMAEKPLHLIEAKLRRLPEHHLMHGLLFFDGWLGVVLYFEDVGLGMLSLCEANLSASTLYGRFSITGDPEPMDEEPL